MVRLLGTRELRLRLRAVRYDVSNIALPREVKVRTDRKASLDPTLFVPSNGTSPAGGYDRLCYNVNQ